MEARLYIQSFHFFLQLSWICTASEFSYRKNETYLVANSYTVPPNLKKNNNKVRQIFYLWNRFALDYLALQKFVRRQWLWSCTKCNILDGSLVGWHVYLSWGQGRASGQICRLWIVRHDCHWRLSPVTVLKSKKAIRQST